MSITSSKNQERFDKIVRDLAFYKHNYNVNELQRIKNRAHQILGFCLIFISIIFGTLTATGDVKILNNPLAVGVLLAGLIVILIPMALCYRIMTKNVLDPIISPDLFNARYRKSKVQDAEQILNDTLFDILQEMDIRNNKLHEKMWRIYPLLPIGFTIIFIPIIVLTISNV